MRGDGGAARRRMASCGGDARVVVAGAWGGPASVEEAGAGAKGRA